MSFTDATRCARSRPSSNAPAGHHRPRTTVCRDAARRGAHHRIKADPSLTHAEIRVVASDDEPAESPPLQNTAAAVRIGAAVDAAAAVLGTDALDQSGTRRAPRFKIAAQRTCWWTAIRRRSWTCRSSAPRWCRRPCSNRISACGCRSSDERGTIRVNAVVAWASFEMHRRAVRATGPASNSSSRTRAAVDAYCRQTQRGLTLPTPSDSALRILPSAIS